MFRKTMTLMIAALLLLMSFSAAAAENGVFGEIAANDGGDERLAVLDEIADQLRVSAETDSFSIEISQAYYEGNCVYVAYRTNGCAVVQDGLDVEDGSYADIIAGEDIDLEDGSVIGWKECVVPDESIRDSLTFGLVYAESYESEETFTLSFTLKRTDYEQHLKGSAPEVYRAEAELYMGKLSLKGTVRIVSPEQAASWNTWFETGEGDGRDVISGWNLYRNGELISEDLDGANGLEGTDEIVFYVMYPRMDDLSGLTLVPVYSEAGEKPEEAVALEAAKQE